MRSLLPIMVLVVTFVTITDTAMAVHPRRRAERWALRQANSTSWHGDFYHTAYGQPVALVVPPTATTDTYLSWGVAQSETRPIWHQFRRPYPGDDFGIGADFLPTPHWPSNTDQFGVYYIRGPW
jgi:hypothetical protein